MLFLLVATGAALGGAFRYLAMTAVDRACGDAFPWGTLVVNAVGGFLLGWALGVGACVGDDPATVRWSALVGTGFCGGLTTFSTFSLQTFSLISKGAPLRAGANVALGVGLCTLCALAGFLLAKGGPA